MHIIVDVRRQIIVQHMGDVGNVETTCGNSCGDQNGSAPRAESLEGHLALTLRSIAVDGGSRKVVAHEEITEHVCHPLRLDKDEGQAEVVLALTAEDIKQDAALVIVFDIFNFLGDVLAGAPNTTNAQEDVVLQEVLSEHLNVTGEGGAKHEGLTLGSPRHIFALDNTSDLGLETHVQHTIGLIKDQVLDVSEADPSALDEVD